LVNVLGFEGASATVPGGFGGLSFGGNLKDFGEIRVFCESTFFPRSAEPPLIFYAFGVQLIFNTE
jgi:hypothetical protein